MSAPIITLTTDFGAASAYVAILKGALLAHCPQARLVDLGHDFAPGDVFAPAFHLLRTCFYYPAGTVHLIGLDPGKGPDRVLVASAAGQHFLALDNGVLGLALEREPEAEVWAGAASRRGTFVARDVLAPLAARLAQGVQAKRLGEPVSDWMRQSLPRPRRQAGELLGEVLHLDRFGNLITNFQPADAPHAVAIAGQTITRWASSYAELAPGELAMLWGAEGWLEISAGGASAAQILGAARATPVAANSADR